MTDTASFGRWIKLRRVALGFTQGELAKRLGCAAVTVRKIEADERRPSERLATRLAQQLQLARDEAEALLACARAGGPPPSPEVRVALLLPQVSKEIPKTLTPLVGREPEAAACALLLSGDARLLTLTGPGGIGKTRLAMEVAKRIAPRFRDGAAFVSLATISDPANVLAAVGQSLGLREASSRSMAEQLLVRLRSCELLLVLDNFEHVADAASDVAVLLAACQGLTCIVTSRTPLHISGEHQRLVEPLALPPATSRSASIHDPARLREFSPVADVQSYPAIDLFIQRARAARPDLPLTAQNLNLIIEICARVDGLPLAIELAAALVRVLPLAAILSRLDQRLHVLVGGPRDLPPRQQTLRNTIAWSYNLLSTSGQALFRRLSMFVGGFSPAGAEAVAGLSQQGLAREQLLVELAELADHSLLRQVGRDDEEPRYMMLETIREYGLERLEASGDTAELHEAHSAFFLALAEAGAAQLKSDGQARWLAHFEIEHDNLRSALRYALGSGRRELALRLCGALGRFWFMHGHLSEGRRWSEAALTMGEPEELTLDRLEWQRPSDKALAAALNAAGLLARYQSDIELAAALCGESLRQYRKLDDKGGVAAALVQLAAVARNRGDYTAARTMYHEVLALYGELSDRWGIAHSSVYLGITHWFQGGLKDAQRLVEAGLAIFRSLGALWDIAASLTVLAAVLRDRQDYAAALQRAEESLAAGRGLGDRRNAALSTTVIADCLVAQGKPLAALPHYRGGLVIFNELGDRTNTVASLLGIARAAARYHPGHAARLFAAWEGALAAIGVSINENQRLGLGQEIAGVRARLGEPAFARAWAAGRALALEAAIEDAQRVANLLSPTNTSHQASRNRREHAGQPDTLIALTAREIDVLRLVNEGLSDAQIAVHLVISRRTVNTHLTSIYSKLGVGSRTAAARVARERELV
jgi:predicted ATPase/DNA-binding CsgD family transcriptional regulator